MVEHADSSRFDTAEEKVYSEMAHSFEVTVDLEGASWENRSLCAAL